MLSIAQKHLNAGQSDGGRRVGSAHAALVFASLKLARRVFEEAKPSPVATSEEKMTEAVASTEEEVKDEATETKVETVEGEEGSGETEQAKEEQANDVKVETIEGEEDVDTTGMIEEDTKPAAEEVALPKAPKQITCRKVFVYVVQSIGYYAQVNPEKGVQLYLEAALTADKLGAQCESDEEKQTYGSIANEMFSLCCTLYEEQASKDIRIQKRCVVTMISKLMACRSLGKDDYEQLIMKISMFSAKMAKQSEQCEMVSRCSYLFYAIDDDGKTVVYSNAQRSLECLQRSLKLANACTTADVSNLKLFVDLLDIYLYFFEKENPLITGNYITGLAALIKEHSNGIPLNHGSMSAASEAKNQFLQIVKYIKEMKMKPESAGKFGSIDVSSVET